MSLKPQNLANRFEDLDNDTQDVSEAVENTAAETEAVEETKVDKQKTEAPKTEAKATEAVEEVEVQTPQAAVVVSDRKPLAPVGQAQQGSIQSLFGVLSVDEVRSLELGTPKLISNAAGILHEGRTLVPSDGKTTMNFTVVSVNKRWMVVPGEDGDEAKKHCRVSYNGKDIIETDDNGNDIAYGVGDYLEELRQTYPKARISEYLDIYGIIGGVSNGNPHPEGIVQLQLSRMSQGHWTSFIVGSRFSPKPVFNEQGQLELLVRSEQVSGRYTYSVCKFDIA